MDKQEHKPGPADPQDFGEGYEVFRKAIELTDKVMYCAGAFRRDKDFGARDWVSLYCANIAALTPPNAPVGGKGIAYLLQGAFHQAMRKHGLYELPPEERDRYIAIFTTAWDTIANECLNGATVAMPSLEFGKAREKKLD
jgi:hypothetical protein